MKDNTKAIKIETFEIDNSGRYAIQITASIEEQADLSLQIDNIHFREIPPEKNAQQFNNPAGWNGSALKGHIQTNIYILYLTKGNHTLRFVAVHGQVLQLRYNLTKISDQLGFEFNLNIKANNVERCPLINFVIVDQPGAQVKALVSTCWHFDKPKRGDGDDIQLIIDNETYTNDDRYNWMWHATPEQEDLEKIEFKSAYPMLENGIHYIEFVADRSPKIHKVIIYTQPVFDGDYLCQVALKSKQAINGEDLEYKLVLGVYIPSGNPEELTNDNVKLFYKNKEVNVKLNAKSLPGETAFDFSGRWFEMPDKKWFFYGIDTSWVHFASLVNDYDYMDGSNWKIIRKKG